MDLFIEFNYCITYEVMNIRSNEIDKSFNYSYYLTIKKNKDYNQLYMI